MKRFAVLLLPLIGAACMDQSPTAPDTRAPVPELSLGSGGNGVVLVTNSDNSGNGSFRHAVETANSKPAVRRIEFLPRVGVIRLQTPVVFTGAQDLAINGKLAALDGSLLAANQSAFLANGGGDLTITGLSFRKAPGNGAEVQVPASAGGTVKITLVGVEAVDNLGFGILINDQLDPSTTDGVQPNPAGSNASLSVTVLSARFASNGYSVSDRDGLRINEGGNGDLIVNFNLLRAEDNAADGVELDERGPGDVRFSSFGSSFARNGKLDPADLDDGLDVDEYDDGGLFGTLLLTSANDNFEEGFDFNENNAGDLQVEMRLVEGSRNGEEGIDFEEDDDFEGGGNLVATLNGVTANGNKGGDAGVKIRERGDGGNTSTLTRVTANHNLTTGIQVRESNPGDVLVQFAQVVTNGNALHGLDFQESSTGNLTGTVRGSTSSGNTGAGVNAAQTGAGTGAVTLQGMNFGAGNTGGNTASTGVVFTIQ